METTTFDERQAGTFTRRGVTFHRTWFDRNVYGGTIGFCTDNGVPALRRTFAAEGAEISVQAGYVVAFVTLAP
jgi:hypothetical protein